MDSEQQAVESGLKHRHIAAATVGNALEFYDFITYSFFAIQIGHAFFPTHSAFASLMLSLATFGVGFVTRPIGGFVIGLYSDRVGRRAAMILSFSLMGSSIVALALIPTYRSIGIAAPILAILSRMVQGFSLGGEVGPNTAYLVEAALPNRRGLAVSFQGVSQGVAATTGGLVGVGLTWILSPAALDAYGWRIAFLLGGVALPFGLWLRHGIPETLNVVEATAGRAQRGAQALRENKRVIILGLMVLATGTIATYVFNYLATFAQNTLHMSARIGFEATVVGNVGGILAVLYGGWLSDKVGRRPVMIWSNLAYLLLVYPMYLWMVDSRSGAVMLIANAILCIGSMPYGAFYAGLAESLPKGIRGSGFATIYAIAIASFGGTCQLVITWLIHVTGSPMAPTWYLVAAGIVGQVAMLLMPESAPVRVAREAGTPQPFPVVS